MSALPAHRLHLKHARAVQNYHPWIFSGAVAKRVPFGPNQAPVSGLLWHHCALAAVMVNEQIVGWAADRGSGSLCARVLRWGAQPPDETWLAATVRRALDRRRHLHHLDAYRLFFADADGIGGVVADLLGRTLVVEYSGAFAFDNAATIEACFAAVLGSRCERIVRRHDRVQLKQEGIDLPADWEPRSLTPPEGEWINEHGVTLQVHPGAGQKTGYYCDQRENRARIAEFANGRVVLDAFCYTGGFGLQALRAGAREVVFADSSAAVLDQAARNVARNGFTQPTSSARENLFEAFRAGRIGSAAVADFDLIIVDPPKLAADRGGREKALRAYKELNRAVISAVADGALVATFSCSGSVTRADFELAVAWAAKDAGREVRVIDRLGQGADHPVPLHLPEMEYLKGLLLRVEDR